MSFRTAVRVSVAIAGLLLVLVALRGWRVARRQYDLPGEGLALSDSTEATQEAISKGRALFHGLGTCAVCHGQQLEGGVGPTLRAHLWKDAKGGEMPAIYAVITHGVPNTAMVAHPGGINDVQAMQLSAYVWADSVAGGMVCAHVNDRCRVTQRRQVIPDAALVERAAPRRTRSRRGVPDGGVADPT